MKFDEFWSTLCKKTSGGFKSQTIARRLPFTATYSSGKITVIPDYKTKFLFEALNDLNKSKHQLKAVKRDRSSLIKIDNIKTYHEIRRQHEGSTTKLYNR